MRIPGSTILEGYDLALAKESVGMGWHPLLERAWKVKPPALKIIQVKEKAGALLIYFEDVISVDLQAADCVVTTEYRQEQPSSDAVAFHDLLLELEAESLTICEECGLPGRFRSGRWMRTLCDRCSRTSF